jgi:hypothetical protein
MPRLLTPVNNPKHKYAKKGQPLKCNEAIKKNLVPFLLFLTLFSEFYDPICTKTGEVGNFSRSILTPSLLTPVNNPKRKYAKIDTASFRKKAITATKRMKNTKALHYLTLFSDRNRFAESLLCGPTGNLESHPRGSRHDAPRRTIVRPASLVDPWGGGGRGLQNNTPGNTQKYTSKLICTRKMATFKLNYYYYNLQFTIHNIVSTLQAPFLNSRNLGISNLRSNLPVETFGRNFRPKFFSRNLGRNFRSEFFGRNFSVKFFRSFFLVEISGLFSTFFFHSRKPTGNSLVDLRLSLPQKTTK